MWNIFYGKLSIISKTKIESLFSSEFLFWISTLWLGVSEVFAIFSLMLWLRKYAINSNLPITKNMRIRICYLPPIMYTSLFKIMRKIGRKGENYEEFLMGLQASGSWFIFFGRWAKFIALNNHKYVNTKQQIPLW